MIYISLVLYTTEFHTFCSLESIYTFPSRKLFFFLIFGSNDFLIYCNEIDIPFKNQLKPVISGDILNSWQ